jgi:hypothetical protein
MPASPTLPAPTSFLQRLLERGFKSSNQTPLLNKLSPFESIEKLPPISVFPEVCANDNDCGIDQFCSNNNLLSCGGYCQNRLFQDYHDHEARSMYSMSACSGYCVTNKVYDPNRLFRDYRAHPRHVFCSVASGEPQLTTNGRRHIFEGLGGPWILIGNEKEITPALRERCRLLVASRRQRCFENPFPLPSPIPPLCANGCGEGTVDNGEGVCVVKNKCFDFIIPDKANEEFREQKREECRKQGGTVTGDLDGGGEQRCWCAW